MEPAVPRCRSQLLGNVPVRFWHDQIFWKPPKLGGVVAWHQIIRIGSEQNLWHISPVGAGWMIPQKRMAACNIFPGVMNGVCYPNLLLPGIAGDKRFFE
jgi:hypothetical protein